MGPSKLKIATDRTIIHVKNGNTADSSKDEIFTVEEAINGSGAIGAFQAKLIVFCCFVWMARGVDEVITLLIGPLLSCNWNLYRWQTAIVVTGTQLMTAFGCVVYGVWTDKYGRRSALSSSLIFFFVFGAVSAGLPNYPWFVVFRMVSAFAVGGLAQGLVLVTEFTPRGQRGRVTFILSSFWAVGIFGMMALLFSTADLPEDWRTYIAISSIPSCIAMIVMKFFPETVRYLNISNEEVAANIIMEEIASTNKQNLPNGILEPAVDWTNRGRISDLFGRKTIRTTCLFIFLGFGTAVSYGGLSLISPIILSDANVDAVNVSSADSNFLGDVYLQVGCLPNVTQNEFIEIMWTTALDFPGVLVYMILVDIIKRRVLLSASCFLTALFTFLLYLPTSNNIARIAFLYCSRILLVPQFDLILLMTAEANPTTHRGTAVGLSESAIYIGFFLNPYIYQGFGRLKYLKGFYGSISLLSAIAGVLLPLETRGRALRQIPQRR